MFRNKANFSSEELSAPRRTPKLEDYPLGVRDCSFTRFAAILHIRDRFFSFNLRTPSAVVTGTHVYFCENYNRPESEAVGNVVVYSTVAANCQTCIPAVFRVIFGFFRGT